MEFKKIINVEHAKKKVILKIFQRAINERNLLKKYNTKILEKGGKYFLVYGLGLSRVEFEFKMNKKIVGALVDRYNSIVLHQSLK